MSKDLEEVLESTGLFLGSPFEAGKKSHLTPLGLEHVFDAREHSKETLMAEDEYLVRNVIQHKDSWHLPCLKVGSKKQSGMT